MASWTAEEIREITKRSRELKKELSLAKGELAHLAGLFPEIMEAREHFLCDDELVLEAGQEQKTDPTKRFIQPDKFKELSNSERNNLALKRYTERDPSPLEIGKMFERFIGYRYEVEGWDVEFKGIVDGYDDLGRDLICKKSNLIEIVQAKCWSAQKQIRENVVFQLYATMVHYELELENNKMAIKGVLAVTTDLSPTALEIATRLGIEVRKIKLDKSYPMIKCNKGSRDKKKVYHLPFDQQYDKIKIELDKDETYVATAEEAEKLGFRRAWRWQGEKSRSS